MSELEVNNLVVAFGGVKAINDVSFRPLVDYSPSIELYAVWMPEKQAPFVDDLLQAVSEAQEANS